MAVDRSEWLDHVQGILRSRHYQWIAEGLGGEPVDVAMTQILTDIRHICRLGGYSFDDLLGRSAGQAQQELASKKA